MPFTAKLNGKVVSIENFNEEDRKLKFLCRECNCEMSLVLPDANIINHFRHLNSTCGVGGESVEHLKMKKICRELLSLNNLGEYNYEVPKENVAGDETNKNRIDLEYISDRVRYAIECQASNISINDMYVRTINLRCLGYKVLWVLSAKNFNCYDEERNIKETELGVLKNQNELYYLDTDEKIFIRSIYEKQSRILYTYDGISYDKKYKRKCVFENNVLATAYLR